MQAPNEFENVIEKVIEQPPYELVAVEYIPAKKRATIRVLIDKQGGITIDDITALSRQISVQLDVEMPNLGAYLLEVSSPGLDRPLTRPEHFKNQLNQKVHIHLKYEIEGRRNFKGELHAVAEDGITLKVEDHSYHFTFEQIDKARVIPDIKFGKKGKEASS